MEPNKITFVVDKFKPGDVAIAKNNIKFCDGTKHIVGQKIVVTEQTVSYYNVNGKDYDKSY